MSDPALTLDETLEMLGDVRTVAAEQGHSEEKIEMMALVVLAVCVRDRLLALGMDPEDVRELGSP